MCALNAFEQKHTIMTSIRFTKRLKLRRQVACLSVRKVYCFVKMAYREGDLDNPKLRIIYTIGQRKVVNSFALTAEALMDNPKLRIICTIGQRKVVNSFALTAEALMEAALFVRAQWARLIAY